MTEFIKKTLNGNAQLISIIAICLTMLTLLGGVIGIYANIYSNINENRRQIADVKERLNELAMRTEKWQADEKSYDAEVRGFVLDADKEIRQSMRLIAEKLIDLGKR
jgi:hypothetical protein